MSKRYFSKKTFQFLAKLEANNHRSWFEAHKEEYETFIRTPALELISDLQQPLLGISPHYRAIAKKVGGSLFRVMRDTRFEHEGGPYKPWIGLRFHHERARDVHAPGFYAHLSLHGESFIGGGLWRPESASLKKMREFMVDNPNAWKKATNAVESHFSLDREDVLSRPPRGYPLTHALIEDLKLKSFTASRPLRQEEILSDELLDTFIQSFQEVSPLIDYLCAALDLEF